MCPRPSLSRAWLPPLAGLLIVLSAPDTAARDSVTQACPAMPPAPSPWVDREASIHRYGALPEACLKALVRQCADTASGTFMDGDSAATCSVRYEALLHHRFHGNFAALLEWWRGPRE